MLGGILKASKHRLKKGLDQLRTASILAAGREQGLMPLYQKLGEIVPDISDQYTSIRLDTEMLQVSTRMLHAFQVQLALKALEALPEKETFLVVDVGDSSGTHLAYLRRLQEERTPARVAKSRFLSVNLEAAAVVRIRAKGGEALLCRAEELLENHRLKADVLLLFETLEHLCDPVGFLDNLSRREAATYFVLTVPYVAQSRVGLHHIRHGQSKEVTPETTHIFELAPADWRLLFLHTGWQVMEESIFRQYPRWSPWRVMKPVWRKLDFEGFYGAILRRERRWAECYRP
jgi:hypothetical protein